MRAAVLATVRPVIFALCVAALLAPCAGFGKTLGFAVTSWYTAIYESRFIDECPDGFNVGYDEIWWRGLSKADRARLTNNGLRTRESRFADAIHRGPNGEDTCIQPTAVTDPPLMTAEGGTSFGMNLDGTADGHATPKSCPHHKFTGVDGTPAVDDQLYRVLGCVFGFRSHGSYEMQANEARKTDGQGMILIEITGVEDPRNSPDVRVSFYRGLGAFALNGSGNFVPFASYRIDGANGSQRYGSTVRGKIENGVLTTESADVHIPFYGNHTYMNQLFRDFRLRLEIAPDGAAASGLAAGYYSVDQLMFYIGGLGPIQSTGYSNCPSIYVAAHELADGYPDPETGECTALSAAYNVQGVAAFVIHPSMEASDGESAPGPLQRLSSYLRSVFRLAATTR